jgi:hypothetical protein
LLGLVAWFEAVDPAIDSFLARLRILAGQDEQIGPGAVLEPIEPRPALPLV